MRLKKGSFWVQLQSGQVYSCGVKTQNDGNSQQNRPSQAQNRSESNFFLGYSNSSWTETNMHSLFSGLSKFWEKVPAFLKSHTRTANLFVCLFVCVMLQKHENSYFNSCPASREPLWGHTILCPGVKWCAPTREPSCGYTILTSREGRYGPWNTRRLAC